MRAKGRGRTGGSASRRRTTSIRGRRWTRLRRFAAVQAKGRPDGGGRGGGDAAEDARLLLGPGRGGEGARLVLRDAARPGVGTRGSSWDPRRMRGAPPPGEYHTRGRCHRARETQAQRLPKREPQRLDAGSPRRALTRSPRASLPLARPTLFGYCHRVWVTGFRSLFSSPRGLRRRAARSSEPLRLRPATPQPSRIRPNTFREPAGVRGVPRSSSTIRACDRIPDRLNAR